MSTVASSLDQAIDALQSQGLTPVTVVLSASDHAALAEIGAWPVTISTRGELRFRGVSVFKARENEGASIVGRGPNGATRRLALVTAERQPELH